MKTIETTKHKHTAGPWHINAGSTNDKRDHEIYSDIANRTYVAAVVHRNGIAGDEVDANARLIAAAPELLKELDKMNTLLANIQLHFNLGPRVTTEAQTLISRANKVITKATA